MRWLWARAGATRRWLRAGTARRAPRVGPAFVAGVGMLRARPVVVPALGAAVLFSLLSVCCGLGLATTPWFLCELFAVQIALCTGRPVVRGLSFVPAGLIMLGAVLMVSSVAWITLLGTGPELSNQTPRLFNLTGLMRSGGFYALISSAIALLVIAPLLYAPLILIEQQTQFDEALVESVRLVVTRGVRASVGLSFLAHVVQIAPLLAATLLAFRLDSSQLALFALCSVPFLFASIPIGQGMIVWSYTQVREPQAPRAVERDPDPAVQAALAATGRHARVWTLLIVLPLASLLLVGLSLVRPSRIPPGVAPPGESLSTLRPDGEHVARVVLPDTALELSVSRRELTVAASDGGGAGILPLRASDPIERLRVVRVRNAYALELRQGGNDYVTFIDRAGVRLDDDLRVRLLDRVGPLQLLIVLGVLLAVGVISVPVLNDLGRVQRGYRMPRPRRPSADALGLDLARSLRHARAWGALLMPLCLVALFVALRATGAL